MPLLLFLLLHQIVLASGSSTYSVKIRRVPSRGTEEDSFELPKSYDTCSSQNECNRFNANLSPRASLSDSCLCSCSRSMAATFGVKNGSWSCIGNKEIRDRELDDCERILLFDNEKEKDPLRTLKLSQQSATLNISANSQCFQNTAFFSCQECDGKWTTLNNTLTDWGLRVTKERSNSVENYMLKLEGATRSEELYGKIMKLAIRCGSEKPFCWLFKVAGQMKCPLKHILTNKPPEPKSTATAATTTTVAGKTKTRKSAFSEAVTSTVHSANSVPKSHVVPMATSVPTITVISTNKATNTWPTDSDIKTIDEGSHEVPITLVIGVAGSAVIVLLLALFFGLLMRRKRRERHKQKPSTSVELKTTNMDSSIVQYASVKEKSRYQSLSPSPDAAMERGVYVSRYKVPETDVNDVCQPVEGPNNKTDEYDYAKSSLVVRNNVLKFSFPLSNKETSSTPDDNGPFYHVLDGEDKGLENQEPSEGDCGKPDEGAPYYRVLEGPNPLDQEGNFHEPEHKGGDDIPKELEPFYHILEGPKDDEQKGSHEVAHESGAYYYAVNGPNNSSDSQGGCGYKDLQSDGRAPIGYQALHKYTYVTCGDSSESR